MHSGCEDIIQLFFNMTLNIKLYHWNTKSYARHKASDSLHTNISGLIDKFIETYIGRYKRPNFKVPFDVKVKTLDDVTIINVLKKYIDFLENKLPTYIKKSDTALLNIGDEILHEFNQALYLFTLH
jgi:hypothetical protein